MAKNRAAKKTVKKATAGKKQTAASIVQRRLLAGRMMNATHTQDTRALLSSFLSRDLDMNYECRWPTDITTANYKEMFERFGVATRVVTIWPDESWIMPPEIYEEEDAQTETKFEQAWKVMNKTLHLLGYLYTVDVVSRIGRYGCLLLGLSDLKANERLDKPVEGAEELIVKQMMGEKVKTSLKYKLLYLKVFQEHDASILSRETNPGHPRYGKPTMYSVLMETPSGSNQSANVHWTRMLHVVPNRLTSDLYGEPQMKPVWNDLLDLRKLKGGAGEGYWRACLSGTMWGLNEKLVDPNIMLTAAQKEEFMTELEEIHNSMQRDIISLGLVPHDVAPKLVDPTPFEKMFIELICIRVGVPVSIFMGREEGKLAADENRSSWIDRVKGNQINYITPMLIEPFINLLQLYGALPQTKEEPKVDWPDRAAPTDKDIADTAVKTIQALSTYMTGGVNQVMGEREMFGQVFKKSPEEIDAIAEEVSDWEDVNMVPEGEPTGAPEDDNKGGSEGNPNGNSKEV